MNYWPNNMTHKRMDALLIDPLLAVLTYNFISFLGSTLFDEFYHSLLSNHAKVSQ